MLALIITAASAVIVLVACERHRLHQFRSAQRLLLPTVVFILLSLPLFLLTAGGNPYPFWQLALPLTTAAVAWKILASPRARRTVTVAYILAAALLVLHYRYLDSTDRYTTSSAEFIRSNAAVVKLNLHIQDEERPGANTPGWLRDSDPHPHTADTLDRFPRYRYTKQWHTLFTNIYQRSDATPVDIWYDPTTTNPDKAITLRPIQ